MHNSTLRCPGTPLHTNTAWANVREFADWYVSSGMPIVYPPSPEVFCSDDATATCLFRQGRFQVELYLIHPKPLVPEHAHPYVDVIEVRITEAAGEVALADVLRAGQTHGPGIRLSADIRGFPLIAIQHWLDRDPTTIAAMWRGPTVGPKHRAIIRRFCPTAYIDDDYADITKPSDYRERLSTGAVLSTE
jgi:hypothetical protein